MGKRVLMAAVTLLALGMFGASGASASGPTRCKGPESGTIKGEVIAESGCNLSGTTVEGNVSVIPGGSLTTNEGSETNITGNVHSNKATEILMQAKGSIGGSVQIQGTTGGSNLRNGTVKGNVQVQNSLAFVDVALETVGGNVQLQNNTGAGGAVGCIATSGPGCAFVGVERSTVVGNVLVGSNSLTATEANEVFVEHNSVSHGNVQIQNNSAAGGSAFNGVLAVENQVGTNLEVHNNTAQGGPTNVVEVSDDTVTSNLACMNDKPPASGHGNTAKKKSGECAAL